MLLGNRSQYHDGKIQYRSRAEANRARKEMKRKTGSQFHLYQCPTCLMWHIGKRVSTSKMKTRNRRETAQEEVNQ